MKAKGRAKGLLTKIHEIDNRRFLGDTAASDIMIDFAAAVKMAELTPLQTEALSMLYIDGYTQQQAADLLGVERSTFAKRAKNGLDALEEIYQYWAFLDEREDAAA